MSAAKRLACSLILLCGVASCVTPQFQPRRFDADVAAAALQDIDTILTALVPILVTFL